MSAGLRQLLFERKFRLSRKGVCLILGLGLMAAFGALNVIAYNQAYRMAHFTRGGARTPEAERLSLVEKIEILFRGVNNPRPVSLRSPSDLGAETVSLRIRCADGPTLGAWYCPAKGADCLVLLFHGYAGEKSSLLEHAKAFLAMGCSVMLVDFRGSGESSESYTTVGYHEGLDVAAAVQYAQRNLPRARLVLYGQSMGAAAILRAVYANGTKPDAVILEAVFDTLLHTAQNRFRLMKLPAFPNAQLLLFWGGWQAGFNPFRHNPVTYAARVSCPALFLHGHDDPRARIEEARAVFAAVPSPKQFKEFPELGHGSGMTHSPAEWRQTIEKFLQEQKLLAVAPSAR